MPRRVAAYDIGTDAEITQQRFVVAHLAPDPRRKFGDAEHRAKRRRRHAYLARRAVAAHGHARRRFVGHPEQRRAVARVATLHVGRGAIDQHRRTAIRAMAGDEAPYRFHSTRMFFSRITFAHLSCSRAIHFTPSSADRACAGSMPSARMRSWTAGSASARRTLASASRVAPSGVFDGIIMK